MKNKPLLDTAMILAAGFGKRLMPLTENIPKALVEFKGKPMVYHVIKKLEGSGIKKIVINTHHLAEKITEYFANNCFDAEIHLVYEADILGSGGAIKNAKKLLTGSGNFLVYNADVDSEMNIQDMFDSHLANNAIATLAVKSRLTGRYLLVDHNNNLIGRTENGSEVFYREPEEKFLKTAFCGIHIIADEIFNFFPDNEKFDMIPEYLKLVEKGKMIRVYDIGSTQWKDLGSKIFEK